MFQDKIKQLQDWVYKSDNIIFFGGAGVSTESGIPDFRSSDGIYHMKYQYPPETILSHHFFMAHTEEFYRFYRDKMVNKNAVPNVAHVKLSQLEEKGVLKGVITQNIDGLHQKAGSKRVLELHGSVLRYYCMKCNHFYDESIIETTQGVPHCGCGGIIKPDVVLYEEPLDSQVLDDALNLIRNAEVLVIGGTSLSVYPAAGLIQYYTGKRLVLINKAVTPYDREANLLINAGLGEVFSEI